jgi:WD40 repeat protein
VTPPPPFKGLAPFQDSDVDAGFFFGREHEREVIEANLMASRLTILYGEPGVGKSSVLRAGLAHHLRAVAAGNLEARGEPGFAVVVFDAWKDDPVQALRAAVAGEVTRALGGSVSPEEDGSSLTDTFGLWQELLGGDLYVILDQTEEYFLYHGAESGPGTFGEEFPAVVGSVDLRVNFLLAIREDAVAKLDGFRRLIPGVLDNYLRLEHLDRRAARAAIVEPIAAYNTQAGADTISVEPELVEAVLDEVAAGKVDVGSAGRGAIGDGDGDQRIETPYLQLVMRRVWDEEQELGSTTLRLETLRRLGGAEQIVRDHVELALAGLSSREKDIAASLFDHLVTPSGAKIAHGAGDLAQYAGVPEMEVLPVLGKLGNERILRSVTGTDARSTRYEIFHDVLADPVLTWKAQHEQTRALESATALARKRHNRLLAVVVVSVLALLVMAGLTVFAFVEQSHAAAHERTARSRALAAGALTQLGVDPELSLLLALKAASEQDTPSVDQVLRTALLESRIRGSVNVGGPVAALLGSPSGRLFVAVTPTADLLLSSRLGRPRPVSRHGRLLGVVGANGEWLNGTALELRRLADGSLLRRAGPVPAGLGPAAVNPAATLAAFATGHGRIVVVDARTGKQRLQLRQASRVTSLAFGAGARLLAAGGADGRVTLWSLADGSVLRVLQGHVGPVLDAAFSPRGSLLATSSTDGTARVFEIAKGLPVAVMSGHSNPVVHVAFSPDGSRIVTASLDGTARVWKAVTGSELVVLRGHRGAVRGALFDGNSFVVTAGDDGKVRRWFVLTEPELPALATLPRPVARAAFVSPSRIEAVTVDGRAHVLDLRGRQLAVHRAARPRQARSAGGAVAVRDGKLVRIEEPGGEVVVLRGHTAPVTSVRFSADGSRVVTASRDRTTRIWDAGTGELLQTLRGHFGVVGDASFSPDGKWIVTAGPGTAALWSADTGELVLYLRGNRGRVTSASFDPSGTTIVTSGVDGTVRTYDCEICRSGAALVAVARARAADTGRTLTKAEQALFVR